MHDMSSLYSEEEKSEAPMDEGSDESAKSEVQPHTELVSKKLMGDHEVKPGDEIVVQVVAIHGDEVEVKYAPAEKDGDKSGGMDEDQQLETLAK
jgi:hypothetical protein